MALDASIILQAGRGVTPLLSREELEDQRAQRELSNYKLQGVRQGFEDEQKLRQVAQSTPMNGLVDAYMKVGRADKAYEARDFEVKQAKTQTETERARLEGVLKQFEVTGRIMEGVRDQSTLDTARQQAAQALGADAASKIPAIFDPAAIERSRMQAMSMKEQLDARYKALTVAETGRHNLVTEANSAGALDVSRGNLSVNQQRAAIEANQPKGQVVQTADGPLLVDPRTGSSRPVMDAAGNPARRPGKDIPANINKSIIENQQSISKIDKAIAEINKKPSSLGTQYMLPGADTLGQYFDPEGVEARAGVADIGSLILHDRSGAAVTASETPRLRPFIPSAGDRPDEAIKKLKRFKEIYEEEAGLLAQTYGADQGYKESPVLRNASTTPGAKSGEPRTVSAADVEATAKSSGRSSEEVRQAMKAKGWRVK